MYEVELKMAVPPGSATQVVAEVHRASTKSSLLAIYFDTKDGCLAKAGVSLRLRREDGQWVQTVKAADSNPARRKEHNVRRTEKAAETPALDQHAHEGTPAGKALVDALAQGSADFKLLREVFRTDVVRHHRTVSVAGGTVELALDKGEIAAGRRRQPILEMEFELKSGEPAAVFAVARQWMTRHHLAVEGRSKATRGSWLAIGKSGSPPLRAKRADPRVVRRATTEVELLRALVRASLVQVVGNASEVAAGQETADHVHQLRVGLRRLCTALRAFDEGLPLIKDVEPALAMVFRDLGTWRDAGVVEESIHPQLQEADAPQFELPQAKDASLSPARLVRGLAFQTALLKLLEFDIAATDEEPVDHKRRRLDKLLDRRLSRLDKQVVKDGARFKTLPEERQHRVRKRLKRLRYLVEFVAPRYKNRAVSRFLAALEPAQDVLGVHNDTVVALERYRSAAAEEPRAWFAAGWLTARLDDSAARSSESLAALGDERRFWR